MRRRQSAYSWRRSDDDEQERVVVLGGGAFDDCRGIGERAGAQHLFCLSEREPRRR
jgi:hypothetical protein